MDSPAEKGKDLLKLSDFFFYANSVIRQQSGSCFVFHQQPAPFAALQSQVPIIMILGYLRNGSNVLVRTCLLPSSALYRKLLAPVGPQWGYKNKIWGWHNKYLFL
eukprot:s2900_g6.t1